MHVIHYINSIDKAAGGTATFLQLLSNNITKDVKISVATSFCDNPLSMPNAAITYFNLKLKKWFELKKQFSTYLKSEKPHLVHINGIWTPQNWLFQKEAQKLGIVVILSPHGMLEPYILKRNSLKKKLAMFLYQNKAILSVNYLHTTAQSELDQVRNLGYKQLSGMIPNGIDISEIEKKQNPFNERVKNILFLSRVHPKKGIEILIDSVSKLNTYKINITIAGEGEASYIHKLKNYAKEKQVMQFFNFVGGLYGEEKKRVFQNADLFVLPTYSENFGIVIVEALASNIPVITTKGTPWEELNLYKCGWWINLSEENLKNTILEAINKSPKELEEMGEKGRVLVEEKYEIKQVTGQMSEFYKWVNDDASLKPNFLIN